MSYRFKRPRPRDEWGQFKSQKQIAKDQQESRLESLRLMQEELRWMADDDED